MFTKDVKRKIEGVKKKEIRAHIGRHIMKNEVGSMVYQS